LGLKISRPLLGNMAEKLLINRLKGKKEKKKRKEVEIK